MCLCLYVSVGLCGCAHLCVRSYVHVWLGPWAPCKGISYVYAHEGAHMNVSPAPGDKWEWKRAWCGAGQVCVTTQECGGRRLSAVRRCRQGRVRKDWRSLRVGELMKVRDPERCVCTCATETLFLFPNSPLKWDAGLR